MFFDWLSCYPLVDHPITPQPWFRCCHQRTFQAPTKTEEPFEARTSQCRRQHNKCDECEHPHGNNEGQDHRFDSSEGNVMHVEIANQKRGLRLKPQPRRKKTLPVFILRRRSRTSLLT